MNPAPKQPDQSTYSGRFAARLRALREKAGLSVEGLGAKLGESGYSATSKTIYNWESGLREPPLDALPNLATCLGLKTVRAILPEK